MANYVKTREQLKDLSDKQLENYVKNPNSGVMTGNALGQGGANTIPGAVFSGDVPLVLVLGEIKRRKDTRATYAKEKDKAATTVADDLTTPSMPLGLRSMAQTQPRSPVQPAAGVGTPQPTPQMNPTMLASKGIGQLNPGAVKQMNDGGIVGFKTGDIVQSVQKKNARANYGPSQLGFADGPIAFPLGTAIGDAASYLNPFSYMDTYNPRVDPITGKVVGGVGDRFADTRAEISAREIQKRDDKASRAADKKIIERQNEIVDDSTAGEEINYARTRQQPPEGIPAIFAQTKDKIDVDENQNEDFIGTGFVLKEDEVLKEDKGKFDIDDKDEASVYDTITDREKDTRRPNYELEMIDKIEVDEIPETSFEELKKAVNMPDTMEAAVQQVKDRRKAAGLSEDPFSKTRKELAELKEGVKKDKSFTKNMALVSVGVSLMTDGDFRKAPAIINNAVKDINNLSGEDRKIEIFKFQTNNADIALKTGMSNEAGKLIADAGKRLQDIEIAELSDKAKTKLKNADLQFKAVQETAKLQQGIKNINAQIEGQIKAAQIGAVSREKVAEIGAEKLQGKPLLFEILSENPDYQKADGSVDAAKIMKDISPPSSMYAAQSKPAQFMAQWNATVEKLSAQPDMETRLTTFLEKYPDPVSFANAMGAGSGMATYSTKGGYKPAGS